MLEHLYPIIRSRVRLHIARGKAYKAALAAVMRKMLAILNAMLAKRERFDPKRARA